MLIFVSSEKMQSYKFTIVSQENRCIFTVKAQKKPVNFAFHYFYFMLVYMPVLPSGFQINSEVHHQKPEFCPDSA